MALVFSNDLKQEIALRHAPKPIVLVDLQLVNGRVYYWSTCAGKYPVRIGGEWQSNYDPWIKSAGPFRLSRSLRTDAGDITVQNVTGDSVQRDVASAVRNGEFWGALCIVRYWRPISREVSFEFHAKLVEPSIKGSDATFRLTQLLDPAGTDAPAIAYSDTCPWEYQSRACGSTSVETSCPKEFAACQVRGASQRFAGCWRQLTLADQVPVAVQPPPSPWRGPRGLARL